MCQWMGPPGNPIDLDPKLTALGAPFLSPTTSQLVVLLSAPTIQSDQAWNTLGSTSKGLQACFRHWTNTNGMWVQFEATLELSPIFTANIWSDLKLLYLVALTLMWSMKFCGLDSIWPRNVHGRNPKFKCVVWSLLDVYQQVSFTQMKQIWFLLEHNVH